MIVRQGPVSSSGIVFAELPGTTSAPLYWPDVPLPIGAVRSGRLVTDLTVFLDHEACAAQGLNPDEVSLRIHMRMVANVLRSRVRAPHALPGPTETQVLRSAHDTLIRTVPRAADR